MRLSMLCCVPVRARNLVPRRIRSSPRRSLLPAASLFSQMQLYSAVVWKSRISDRPVVTDDAARKWATTLEFPAMPSGMSVVRLLKAKPAMRAAITAMLPVAAIRSRTLSPDSMLAALATSTPWAEEKASVIVLDR